MRFFFKSAGFLLFFFCLAAFGTAEPAVKIAFVDIDRVFAAYDKTAGVMENVQVLKDKGREERDNLETEINRLNTELQEKMQVLPGKEIDKRREDIQRKIRELWEFDRAQKMRESEPVHQALNKIYEAVETFGRTGGYDLIVEKRVGLFGRTVLFGKAELDITEAIIGILAK